MAYSTPVALQPWFAVSGLAFTAREDALTSVDDSSDESTIRKRRDEIAEILTIRPLSSRYWLQLAEARVDAHDALAKVIDALDLSVVTGPNEGYMITQRGLFGIWQWEVMPSELRKRAVADLVARQNSSANKSQTHRWLGYEQRYRKRQNRSVKKFSLALQAQGFSTRKLNQIGK